jgi:hypothetical protein
VASNLKEAIVMATFANLLNKFGLCRAVASIAWRKVQNWGCGGKRHGVKLAFSSSALSVLENIEITGIYSPEYQLN